MNFFYSKKDNNKYIKPLKSSDVNLILDDKNKILVNADEVIFYVITYNNSVCELERKILGYDELVEYLQSSDKNVYFTNIDKASLSSIIYDVNNRLEHTKVDYPFIEENIYTMNNDEILKINATVDKQVIKNAINDLYTREYNKDIKKFKKVKLIDFINDRDLLELYNLPLIDKNECFMIPNYSYTHPELFYILNGLYSKIDDNNKIYLNEDNIKDLYLYGFSDNGDIVDRIIKEINIDVVNNYNIDEFSNALNYIERVKKNESDYTINLNNIKTILLKAKDNERIIKELKILENQNNKELKKTVTK